jgi:uncharacterized repeat protein (TIGR03843 family)
VIPDELTPPLAIDVADALALLTAGELTIEGRLVDASNATFYCGVCADGLEAGCVYKPVAGERALWDFPDGTLAERELAAYQVSAATGWGIVPPTVYRDGPLGPGMVQLWITEDESVDVARLLRRADNDALRRIAVLDAVINNADRKGGHLLPVPGGHIHGVDHGVSFHVEDKLRTVLWQWAGKPLPPDCREVLARLRTDLDGRLGETLQQLLTVREVRRTRRRVDALLSGGRHPRPSGDWPPIPWPPF